MLRILINPSTYKIFDFQEKQNPFLSTCEIDNTEANKSHKKLAQTLTNSIVYKVKTSHDNPIPDIVFVANGGLSLPRLPEKVMILPNMKYAQRKNELPFLKAILDDQKIKSVFYPADAVFEGQAEAKWFFGGKLLIIGYGYRATKSSVKILSQILNNVYNYYEVTPPKVVGIEIKDPKFFHLDAAMLEFDDKVIVQRRAFSTATIKVLESLLGHENVFVLDTIDDFYLNAIIDNSYLITHKLEISELQPYLERVTGRKVLSIDASEFEKSGGSIRCMVLDIHPILI